MVTAGARFLQPFSGVFEHLFYLSSITWVLIVAIDLARISGRGSPGPQSGSS